VKPRAHRWITVATVAMLAIHGRVSAAPPADPLCAVLSGACTPPPFVLVMSAFPAEIEPLLAAAQVTETIAIDGRSWYVGTLGGVRVVLVRGGIGLANATNTARTALARFPISAILFSGVAGSGLDIGDVAVPATWSEGGDSFPASPELLAIARTLTSPPVALEKCTPVPPDPPGQTVCLDHSPRIVVGGEGVSSDPYGGVAVVCSPGAGPVFGCEPSLAPGSGARAVSEPDATDMETGAVARVARAAGLPFIGFRGVSDGGGDPLGLPGFPAQFFAYYRLSADNAAAVTVAFLEAWGARDPDIADHARRLRTTASRAQVGAACDWERAADPVCAGQQAPRRITSRVARACRLSARAAATDPQSAASQTADRQAQKAWQQASRLLGIAPHAGLASDCIRALAADLAARAVERSP